MTTLFILRHGNTFEAGQEPVQVGAKTDLALSERGREQAREMATYCSSNKIRPAIITSGPLRRQREAATIISKELCIEDRLVPAVPALIELDYGSWEGLTQQQIKERWPEEYDNWEDMGVWPDGIFGEGEQERLDSLACWLKDIANREGDDQTVITVTSGGIAKLIYRILFPADWSGLTSLRKVRELKVKTGHFCCMVLPSSDGLEQAELQAWNISPADATI